MSVKENATTGSTEVEDWAQLKVGECETKRRAMFTPGGFGRRNVCRALGGRLGQPALPSRPTIYVNVPTSAARSLNQPDAS